MKLIKYILIILITTFWSCTIGESKSNIGVVAEGHKLSEFIDFDQIKNVLIRNVNGSHHLTKRQWKELKDNILNSISNGGLYCKPQWLGFIFELKNGDRIEGTVCGNLINFESKFSGSFEIKEEINFHNY